MIIVKRRGHKEKFDERKIYGSVYAAAASAHFDEQECEKIADEITAKIKKFLKGKKEVNSITIRRQISQELKRRYKELEIFYELHLPNLRHL